MVVQSQGRASARPKESDAYVLDTGCREGLFLNGSCVFSVVSLFDVRAGVISMHVCFLFQNRENTESR